MRHVEFKTVSGQATSSNVNERCDPILDALDRDRQVRLVLDDSNWDLSLTLDKKSAASSRSMIAHSGPTPFNLPANEHLFIFAKLATGGAGTVWNLSVLVEWETP